MKQKYKVLLFIFFVEILVISILRACDVKIESLVGAALGMFLFLLPVQVLLYMLSNDEKFSNRKRKWFWISFWFINVCYCSAVVGSLALYFGLL